VLARVCTDDNIAAALNRNGLRTGRENRWTRQRVISLRKWNQIPCYDQEARAAGGWMNLTEAARFLGVAPGTLRQAVEQGQLAAEHPLSDGPWVFQRRDLESDAARQLVARARQRSPAKANPGQTTFDFFSK
jgi:Helix-turn-helix domain